MKKTKHKFKKITDLQSFMLRTVLCENGCVEWNHNFYTVGYGSAHYKGKKHGAHRLSWILNRGDIPKGMQINHKCDNRKCVNIDHLYLGTHAENMNDMVSRKRYRHNTSNQCKHGHDFTEDNTYLIRFSNGKIGRCCFICKRLRDFHFKQSVAGNIPNIVRTMAWIMFVKNFCVKTEPID